MKASSSPILEPTAISPEEKKRRDGVFAREFMPQMDALYNFAYHLTYNESDAQDLVQETLMKAYRFLDSFQEGTNAKAWLFKILKNAFINAYRKRSRQPQTIDYEEVIHQQDNEDNPRIGYVDLRHEIFQDMMGDEVTGALNALPEEFRTVVLLCDVEGFTYEEIANITDVPIGTVRSRLHRARNLLKERLRRYAEQRGFQDNR